jgi:hypothetical protein
MTISQKQLEANRRNARLSCGPKSEEGKMESARNSFKHGLFSSQVLLEDEDPKEFEALSKLLHEEFGPATPSEALIVDELIATMWRKRRILGIERFVYKSYATYNGQTVGPQGAFLVDASQYGVFGKIASYEDTMDRKTARLLRQLESLKNPRVDSTVAV